MESNSLSISKRKSKIKNLAERLDSNVFEKYGFGSSNLSAEKRKDFKEGLTKILINGKVTPVRETMTKPAIIMEIAENTGLTRKQVSSDFDELAIVIERHIKKRSPGQFTLPGLVKIKVRRKPKTKARKGINPFTGEPMMFKAKPARNVVKIRPLKQVKDMVE